MSHHHHSARHVLCTQACDKSIREHRLACRVPTLQMRCVGPFSMKQQPAARGCYCIFYLLGRCILWLQLSCSLGSYSSLFHHLHRFSTILGVLFC